MTVGTSNTNERKRGPGRALLGRFVPVLLCVSVLVPNAVVCNPFGTVLVDLCHESETSPVRSPVNEDDLVETAKTASCTAARRAGREARKRPCRFAGPRPSLSAGADLAPSLSLDSQNALPRADARRNGVGACLRL